MATKKAGVKKIIRDAMKLAAEDGFDLAKFDAARFAPFLDEWVLSRRLQLPANHPLKRGSFTYSSNLTPMEILDLADQQFQREQAVEKHDTLGGGDDDRIMIGGKEYVRKEDGDNPRDTPPPQFYGEEIEIVPCRKIVVVPGILGSEIVECTPRPGLSDDWKKIWPPVAADSNSIAPLDHLVDTASDQNIPGAPTRKSKILEPAYDGLLGRLRADGYTEENGKLHPWGYDWTKSNRTNGELLKNYINEIAGVTEAHPEGDCVIDVICHSMGGLVTRAAIKSGAVVRQTVYLASPHHGAPKAYFALHPEAPTPLASSWWQKFLINKLWDAYASEVQPRGDDLGELLASFARQFPSVYELLPDEYYFQTNQYFVTLWYWMSSQNVVGLDSTYYTAPDVSFPRQGGMQTKVQEAMRFKGWLGRLPPGDNLSIYSNTENTNDSIVFSYRGGNGFRDPTDSGQAGDGTVPTSSANKGQYVVFNPGTHVALPNRQDTYDKIASYLGLRNGQ